MNTRLITTFAVLVAAASCEKQSDSTAPTTAANVAPPDPGINGLSHGDLQFIAKAAEGGMLEVKLGTSATQRSNAEFVKTFGDRMRVDHGQVNALLQQIAMQKGVRLPTELDADGVRKVDELNQLAGPAFDQKYAADMVKDHEEDVDEFERASKDVADPDLRNWAAKTLPTLKMHLEMAKDMKAKTDAAKSP